MPAFCPQGPLSLVHPFKHQGSKRMSATNYAGTATAAKLAQGKQQLPRHPCANKVLYILPAQERLILPVPDWIYITFVTGDDMSSNEHLDGSLIGRGNP